jgi:hypothetical protein
VLAIAGSIALTVESFRNGRKRSLANDHLHNQRQNFQFNRVRFEMPAIVGNAEAKRHWFALLIFRDGAVRDIALPFDRDQAPSFFGSTLDGFFGSARHNPIPQMLLGHDPASTKESSNSTACVFVRIRYFCACFVCVSGTCCP